MSAQTSRTLDHAVAQKLLFRFTLDSIAFACRRAVGVSVAANSIVYVVDTILEAV